jgi:hypothetical protein
MPPLGTCSERPLAVRLPGTATVRGESSKSLTVQQYETQTYCWWNCIFRRLWSRYLWCPALCGPSTLESTAGWSTVPPLLLGTNKRRHSLFNSYGPWILHGCLLYNYCNNNGFLVFLTVTANSWYDRPANSGKKLCRLEKKIGPFLVQ